VLVRGVATASADFDGDGYNDLITMDSLNQTFIDNLLKISLHPLHLD